MNHADELLDSIDEALIELDFDLTILYVNRQAELLWQIERDKILNLNISDSLIDYFGQQGAHSIHAALIHGEKTFGSYYSNLQKKSLFFSVNRLKASLLLTFFNNEITNRDGFLQDAEAMGYTGSYEGDFATMTLRFSEGLYKLFGYEVNGFQPTMAFIDSVSHPDDTNVVSNIIERARSTGQAYEYTRRIFRPDGEMRYLYSKGRIIHDKHGNPIKFSGTVHDITEQKVAEEETLRNRNLLQAVFDASTLPITLFETVYNENGEVIDFLFVLENEVSVKLWKKGRIGRSLLGLNPGIQGTPIFDLYKKVVESGQRLVSELHLNGDWIQGWFRLTAVKRDNFIVATIENISERKLTENSLKKSLHVLTQAEAIVNMGSWEYDVVEKTAWWSNGMYRIFSSLSKPLSLNAYMELVISENRNIGERIFNCVERTYKPFDEIFTMEINNERKVIQVKGSPLVNKNGQVEAMIGISKDVTEKINADLELKQQSHFIQQIAEASPDLIAVIQVEPVAVTYVNSKIYGYIGFSTEEITRFDEAQIYGIVHPNDLGLLIEHISGFLTADDQEIRELEFRVKNKVNHWVSLKSRTKVFQRDNNGEVRSIISVTQDITDKKVVQRELDRQSHLVQKIAQATPDIIVIFDLLKNSLVYINKELYPLIGITSSEFLKMGYEDWEKFVCKEDLPLIKDYFDGFLHVQKFKVREVIYRIKRGDGKLWWVKARGKVFKRNLQGVPTQIVSVIQDYTPRKEAEEKIRENEFMQALLQKKDEFMSVASHELKTPITSIKASLQILQRQIEKHVDESVLLVFVTKSIVQINKLITLIADLMDNTKIQAGKLQLNITTCSIDDIINDTIMHGFDERQVIVENNVHEPVEVDRIRIEQVLTNFLTNAIKYSPGSKRIVLKVNSEGDFVKIEVQDFGIGIAREKLGYVFDRFFRADESSTQFSGLGLGLYISAEIIQQHYGEFGVESEEGKGSTFWFKIPFKHENPEEAL